MNILLKKLNFKTQESILILNAPEEFQETAEEFSKHLAIRDRIDKKQVSFSLAFCTKLIEVENFAKEIEKYLEDDPLFWFAYPKKSSKKYTCEFNRDNGWQVLGELGFEPVRMVAIDDDWSALRFRKAEHIKELKRNPDWIMSEEGKKKVKK